MTDAPESRNSSLSALGLILISVGGAVICKLIHVQNMAVLGLFPMLAVFGLLQAVRAKRIAEEEQESPMLGKIGLFLSVLALAVNVLLFL